MSADGNCDGRSVAILRICVCDARVSEWVKRTPLLSASCYLVARQLSRAALMDGPHYFPRAVKEKESWRWNVFTLQAKLPKRLRELTSAAIGSTEAGVMRKIHFRVLLEHIPLREVARSWLQVPWCDTHNLLERKFSCILHCLSNRSKLFCTTS